MKYELPMFIALAVIGLIARRFDWKRQFFLALLIGGWIAFNFFREK